MSDSLSDVAWRYFQQRPTYPVLVSVKKKVDGCFDALYLDVIEAVEDAEDVEIEQSVTTSGRYWRSILLELSDSHYTPDNPPESSLEASLRRDTDGKKMIRHRVAEIVREYDIPYKQQQVVSGPDEVAIRSSLEGLGRGYFTRRV